MLLPSLGSSKVASEDPVDGLGVTEASGAMESPPADPEEDDANAKKDSTREKCAKRILTWAV